MDLRAARARFPNLRPHDDGIFDRFRLWCRAGCRKRLWWLRLPILLWCASMWIGHLTDPQASDLIKGLNLGIHELGHILWSPFGEFLMIAGGSLTQCLVPFIGAFFFVRQRDPFALFFSASWLATNLFDVATYCADARAMELPLVTPFGGGEGEVTHDWNWLLDHMGLLEQDQHIAGLLRFMGSLAFFVSLIGMGWCIWRMWKGASRAESDGHVDLH